MNEIMTIDLNDSKKYINLIKSGNSIFDIINISASKKIMYNKIFEKYFPKDDEDRFSEDKCLKAVKDYPKLLKSIPIEKRTTKVCLKAFELNMWCIKYFPKDNPELFAEDICLKAIDTYNSLYRYIPKEYITNKIKERGDYYD